jgi:CDP-diacylglycerol--glycerol-3-phosphate 3-phosphatidyltransferase
MTNPYTIPNLLTAIRIAFIPAIVVLFYLPYHWSDMACGLVFGLVGITDAFDGYLARKLGQVSRLGEFLDPVADKLIVVTALVLIVSRNPTWYVTLTAAVIIGREIAISALREWMSEIGARHKMQVSGVAKFKTIVQIVGLSMMLFREDIFGLPTYLFGLVLTILAAALTLWSMAAYLVAAWPELRGSPET